jgi:hypothetical protein
MSDNLGSQTFMFDQTYIYICWSRLVFIEGIVQMLRHRATLVTVLATAAATHFIQRLFCITTQKIIFNVRSVERGGRGEILFFTPLSFDL